MTAMDPHQQRQSRLRRRRRRHWRRALRVLGPIFLLLATILLSVGIVRVIERDVVISEGEVDSRDSLSAAAQQRKWQLKYDDLLREYYGENDEPGADIGGDFGEMERGETFSVGPVFGEWEEGPKGSFLEAERSQPDSHVPGAARDVPRRVSAPQIHAEDAPSGHTREP